MYRAAELQAAAETARSGTAAVGWYSEMWSLPAYAVKAFSNHPDEVLATLLGAMVLAALCWWGASAYSRLWNLRFRITLHHHVLCLLAAALTLVFSVLFASLRYTRDAAEASIDHWRTELLNDSEWANRTFIAAYEAVNALGIEDFSQHPPPGSGGRTIPLAKAESIAASASIYANSAATDFRQRRPFLSKVLLVRPEIPKERINLVVNEFFAKGGQTYSLEEAIDIAAGEIKSTLQPQTGRVVPLARLLLVALFVLVQIIPFGLIGLAAYQDLKVTT